MNWLVTPGGVSQLLTQLAAMQHAEADLANVRVSSVCYYWGPEMATALQQTCDAFGLEYLGNIEPVDYHCDVLKQSSLFDRMTWRVSKRAFHKKLLVRKGWNAPTDIDGLVACLRPWVYDELFLYSVLRPKQLICVIDGINPRSPNRSLRGRAWRGLDAPFRDLPCDCPVFCPEYLTDDGNQLGNANPIPHAIEQEVFARYRPTPLAREFGELLEKRVAGRNKVAIVFSQQLAQSEYLDAEQEIQYYLKAFDALQVGGYEAILLKQHPRDPKPKLAALKAATAQRPEIVVVPDHLSCVPIEPFLGMFGGCELLGVSTNSTVLLSFRALTSASAVSFDSPYFTNAFRQDRDEFCRKHNVEVITP